MSKEILQSHLGGAIVLQKFIETIPGYLKGDEDNEKTCQVAADEQLTTYLYLINADQEKYGSVLKGLNSQKALNNDQFPKIMVDGHNVLSNHRFDNAKETNFNTNKKNNRDRRQQSENDKNNNDKKDDASPTLSFAQMEGKCYCCGKTRHKSPPVSYTHLTLPTILLV